MPSLTVTLEKMGDAADTAVVLEWLTELHERVEKGQPLLLVETAKVEVQIPAPASGVLVERSVAVDDEVDVGAPLAVIQTT